jgi:hypothetical protein
MNAAGQNNQVRGRSSRRRRAMDERAILDRIIGPGMLDDVVAAFSGTLLADPRYTWSASVARKGEVIEIVGSVFCGEQPIGRFSRRLQYAKGLAQAWHEVLEIADAHQRRGIATAHYRRCLAFYDRVGISRVTLDAAGVGPFVWPRFGFDLAVHMQREQVRSRIVEAEIEPVPALDSLLAPAVVDIKIEGDPLGARALAAVARASHGSLRMVLDLRDPRQRAVLVKRGIL